MAAEKWLLIKRGVPFLLIGLLIFVIYIFFVGMEDIVMKLQLVDPFYYSLAILSVLLNMLFHSLTWKSLLNLLSIKAPFKKTFLYVLVGTFVDLLVPAESVSGEVSRVYLMSKETSENAGKVVASVVSHRILTMSITLSSLVIGSVFFILKYEPAGLVVIFITVIAICTATSLALLLYLSFKKRATGRIVDWIVRLLVRIFRGRWQLTRLKSQARQMLEAFHQSINVLGRHPKGLIWPVAFSIIAWFFSLLLTFLVFISLGEYGILLSAIIIVYSISAAIQGIPLGIPGMSGFVQIMMASLYTLLLLPQGISHATTVTATMLVWIITYWFKLFVGFVAVQWVGIKTLMGGTS
jgi:uncharacterized protein (TIRG00374 family)